MKEEKKVKKIEELLKSLREEKPLSSADMDLLYNRINENYSKDVQKLQNIIKNAGDDDKEEAIKQLARLLEINIP